MGSNTRETEQEVLATVVYGGWVTRAYEDDVVIRLDTPQGERDIHMTQKDFYGEKIPEVGQAIRYRATIESAHDLESEPEPEWEGLIGRLPEFTGSKNL